MEETVDDSSIRLIIDDRKDEPTFVLQKRVGRESDLMELSKDEAMAALTMLQKALECPLNKDWAMFLTHVSQVGNSPCFLIGRHLKRMGYQKEDTAYVAV